MGLTLVLFATLFVLNWAQDYDDRALNQWWSDFSSLDDYDDEDIDRHMNLIITKNILPGDAPLPFDEALFYKRQGSSEEIIDFVPPQSLPRRIQPPTTRNNNRRITTFSTPIETETIRPSTRASPKPSRRPVFRPTFTRPPPSTAPPPIEEETVEDETEEEPQPAPVPSFQPGILSDSQNVFVTRGTEQPKDRSGPNRLEFSEEPRTLTRLPQPPASRPSSSRPSSQLPPVFPSTFRPRPTELRELPPNTAVFIPPQRTFTPPPPITRQSLAPNEFFSSSPTTSSFSQLPHAPQGRRTQVLKRRFRPSSQPPPQFIETTANFDKKKPINQIDIDVTHQNPRFSSTPLQLSSTSRPFQSPTQFIDDRSFTIVDVPKKKRINQINFETPGSNRFSSTPLQPSSTSRPRFIDDRSIDVRPQPVDVPKTKNQINFDVTHQNARFSPSSTSRPFPSTIGRLLEPQRIPTTFRPSSSPAVKKVKKVSPSSVTPFIRRRPVVTTSSPSFIDDSPLASPSPDVEVRGRVRVPVTTSIPQLFLSTPNSVRPFDEISSNTEIISPADLRQVARQHRNDNLPVERSSTRFQRDVHEENINAIPPLDTKSDGSLYSWVPSCYDGLTNFCSFHKDYPVELMTQVMAKYQDVLIKLYSDLGIVNETLENKQEMQKDEKFVCESMSQLVSPGWAKEATTGKWLVIVNGANHFQQTIRIESCTRQNEACLFISPYYQSSCVQRESERRLVAIDPLDIERGPFVGAVSVPCGCSCHVGSLNTHVPIKR